MSSRATRPENHRVDGTTDAADEDAAIDEDAPARSLIDEDEDAVEPNEPA